MAVLATMNLKQVQNAMKDFAEKDIRNMSKSAVRKTANRVKTRVKSLVPKETGNLKNSIKVKNERKRKTKEPISFISIRGDKKTGKKSPNYYTTLLYGYREAYVKKNGTQVEGHEVKNPSGNWFEKAVNIYGKEFEGQIAKFLKDNIRKAAAKQYTKTAIAASKVK